MLILVIFQVRKCGWSGTSGNTDQTFFSKATLPCNNAIMRTFPKKRAQRRSLVTCDRQPRGFQYQRRSASPFTVQNFHLDFLRSRRFCPHFKSLPSFMRIFGGGEKTNGLFWPIFPVSFTSLRK